MSQTESWTRPDAVRRFNRFYTRQLGLLQGGLLQTPFTLTDARVLYEVAQRAAITASELGAELGLDAGYMSRVVGGLKKRGLLRRARSAEDGRSYLLSLTKRGQAAFGQLDDAARNQMETMLGGLASVDQDRLVRAMQTIEVLLGAQPERRVPYVLRPPRSGDMGWVVQRHGELYEAEYGWDEHFEALVAEIVARFIQNFDGKRERCWMAEREGENVGCVFLVKHGAREGVAQLRLLLVEPGARGLGIGKRLVQECTRFARQARYHTITLWTNSVLLAARGIYEQEGYRLVEEEPHHSFGHDLIGQNWEKQL
jgi:DNA-binding MarR family transcriptional regulator/GNAT superfamily N-acetyltransferase